MVDHGTDGRVVLAVLLIQIHGLGPQQRLLARAQHLDDVHAAPEDLDVLHELLGGVLRVQHGQLGEDAGMGVVQTQTLGGRKNEAVGWVRRGGGGVESP